MGTQQERVGLFNFATHRKLAAVEAIKTRLGNAAKELEYGRTAGNFDRVFVNADLKNTFEELASAFKEWFPHLNEVAPDDEDKNCACVIS